MSNYKDLDLLLDKINTNDGYKRLLKTLPLGQFFSVQNWPLLQKHLHRYMIFWLHKPILVNGALKVDTTKSFVLPIGVVHYLLTETLSVGYIIELPKKIKLEITNTYINILRGKVDLSVLDMQDLPPLEHILHDKHLCVYQQNNSQLIASNKPMVDFLT